MPIRPEKEQMVVAIKEKFEKAQTVVLADYRGLNVAEVTKLRAQLREQGIEFKILKNTLTRLAAHQVGVEGLDSYLEGPTALAFGYDDPVAPAKILNDFAQKAKHLEIKAGVLQGKVVDVDGIKALANLPPREILLAKVFGSMQAPISGLANVLQGTIRNMVYALDAVRQQKEAQA